MKNLTIQQGIYLLSTLVDKAYSLRGNLNSYKVPLSVNGKDVTDRKKSEKMLKEIEELKLYQEDIINLKSKLAKANIETMNEGKSINQLLEEVRNKREFLSTLKHLLTYNQTKVENSVGVVQYGTLNEEYIEDLVNSLETEVNELSQKIDILNSNTYIEINLLTEK